MYKNPRNNRRQTVEHYNSPLKNDVEGQGNTEDGNSPNQIKREWVKKKKKKMSGRVLVR